MAKKKKLLTPQQEKFLANYIDPKSETYNDAKASALKAGYSDSFSRNITHLMPAWLSDSIGDNKLLNKSIKALDKTLDDGYDEYETEEGMVRRDSSLSRIQQDSAKFIASTVGRKRFGKDDNSDNDRVVVVPIYAGWSIKGLPVQGHSGDAKSLPAGDTEQDKD